MKRVFRVKVLSQLVFAGMLFMMFSSNYAFSQNILISQGGTVTVSGGEMFYDAGGPSGNDGNTNYTITLCPANAGDMVALDFNYFKTTFDWMWNEEDALYIYDGPTATGSDIGKLMGDYTIKYNTGVSPYGMGVEAYGANPAILTPTIFSATNSTGCLTLFFENTYSSQFIGWEAEVIVYPALGAPGCNIEITGSTATICAGESVDLTAIGSVVSAPINVDFNNSSIGTGWAATSAASFTSNACSHPSLDGSIYLWMQNAPGPRSLETNAMDVSNGGSISFEYRQAINNGDSSPCESPDQGSGTFEGIYLQYSINGGTSWTTFKYIYPNGTEGSFGAEGGLTGCGNYVKEWTKMMYPIPAAAQTVSTKFRWLQDKVTSSTTDNWGLDNIIIGSPMPSTITITDLSTGIVEATSTSSPLTVTVTPDATTTYRAIITDGSTSCQSDFTVTVNSCGITPCGTCTTPDCPIAGPFADADEANQPANQCSAQNILATPVTNTTYVSYSTVTASADGQLGAIVSVGTTQLVGFSCDVIRTALLYPADPCTPGTAIAPDATDANPAITFYNPEWYNLTPGATYILEVTYQVPAECQLDDLCQSYYQPEVLECGNCTNPSCPFDVVATYEDRTFLECNWIADITNTTYVSCHLVTSDANGTIGAIQQVNALGSVTRTAELYLASGGQCTGGPILVNDANAHNVGSGFNPEWIGLIPNTQYILCITTVVDEFTIYGGGCLDIYSVPVCNVYAGTYTVTINGIDVTDPSNEYILCDQDNINIVPNGDAVLPPPATATPSAIIYGLYSCTPTSANPANDDPGCFNNETIELGESLPYTNNGGSTDPFIQWMAGQNALSNNTFWFVPMTADWADDYSNWNWDANTDDCYALGTPIKVTYLNPIVVTPVEDCANGSVSLTITGGSPELIGGTSYSITNTGAGSLSATTLNSSGGNVVISGLANGDSYSISITDGQGCTKTFTGGPFLSCACSANAGTVTVLIDGIDVTNPSNTYTVCWGQSIDFVSDNNYILPPASSTDPRGLGYALWSSYPSNADPTANAGYLGYDYNSSTGDINNGTGFPTGTFYIAAVTMDDICNSWPCDSGIGHDVNGDDCYDVGVIMEFTFLPQLTTNAGTDQAVCQGGSVTLSATGASTYSWSNGITQGVSFIPASTTTYTVTATDANGCTATDNVIVTVNAAPNANAGTDVAVCNGQSVTLTATGGTSYAWNNGISQGTAFTPGATTTYTVTVTGTGGCTATDNVQITVNSLPTANAGTDQSICENQTVLLTATGGTSYNWNNGVVQGTPFSPAATATYSVTVTDANNCTDTDDVIVSVNPLPVANAGTDQTVCSGQSVTLSATGGGTYTWNNSVSQGTPFTPATTANYTVTVTTAAGCTGTDAVTVTVNPLPTANAGTDQQVCDGSNVTLTATGGISYQWSNGITQSTAFTPSVTAIYTVTVTDANNCTATDNVNVTVNAIPVANAGPDQAICDAASATLTATGGTTYAWSTGATTASISVSPASATTYTVTATSNGCSSTDDVTVTVVPAIVPSISTALSQICQGDTTILTASGGSTYIWNNGQTTPSISVSPGTSTTYTVTAYSSGCSGTADIMIMVSDSISITVSPSTICEGESTTITVSNGGQYYWNTGANTSSITVSPSVTTSYYVTVTDNVCTASTSVTVNVNSLPTANAGSDQTICAGESVNLIASGGTSYEWNTGQQNQFITVSPTATATYIVTVTNGGCSASDQVIVNVTPLPNANAGNDIAICDGSSATLTATGGTTYSWNNGQNSQSITVSPAVSTTYTVTVSDNGCSASDDINVTINALPLADAGADQTICAGNSTSLTASGGSSYMWSTNSSSQTINVSPVVNTTYYVTVTQNSCTEVDSVTISVSPAVIADAYATLSQVCTNQSSILTALGGSSFEWSTGETAQSITVSPQTTTVYSVTVTANGCSDVADIQIIALPSITATSSPSVICEGESTILTVSTGDVYQWSTGETTQSIVVSPTTTTNYYVTVSANGCTDSTVVNVAVVALPLADAGPDTTICTGSNITLTATGGTSYIWSNSMAGASIDVNPTATTTYYVTVSNSNGCSSTDWVTVNVNPVPVAQTGADQTICEGQTVKLTAYGGDFYTWSPAGTLNSSSLQFPSATPVATTTYTVTVTNEYGCTDSETTTVFVNQSVPVQVNISAIPGTSVCHGELIDFTAFVTNGGTNPVFEWSIDGVVVGTNSSQLSTDDLIDGAFVSCQVISSDVCVTNNPASDELQITVHESPVANFSFDNLGGCDPVTINFTDLSTVQYSDYSWTFANDDMFYASNQRNPAITFEEPGIYDVTLTVTSASGCENSITYNNLIRVYVTPTADFYLNPTSVTTISPTVVFTNLSSNADFYIWNMGDGTYTSTPQFSHDYLTAGTYTVTLYAQTLKGCIDSLSSQLLVEPEYTFYAPNAFVPSLMGNNNLFSPKGNGINTADYRLLIYDRWGELIFETDRYDVSEHGEVYYGWDGKSRNGAPSPVGVYTWLVIYSDLGGRSYEKAGTVTLIR